MTQTDKLIKAVEQKVNDKRYYYSQNRENQFATDCSWLIITSLQEIGIPTNGATYTGNMCKELSCTGYFSLYPFRYTDIIRGDILVKHINGNNGHTVLYIGDGKILEACNKKYGLRKCNYYANGYQYILRLKENCTVNDLPLIKKGSKGLAVCFLQLFLNKYMGNRLVIDGDFGNKTHEATLNAQIKMGFSGNDIDGEIGVKTWTKIYSTMVHG